MKIKLINKNTKPAPLDSIFLTPKENEENIGKNLNNRIVILTDKIILCLYLALLPLS